MFCSILAHFCQNLVAMATPLAPLKFWVAYLKSPTPKILLYMQNLNICTLKFIAYFYFMQIFIPLCAREQVYSAAFAHIIIDDIPNGVNGISATQTFLKAKLIRRWFKVWLVFFKKTMFKSFGYDWANCNATKVITFESFWTRILWLGYWNNITRFEAAWDV